MKIIIIVNYINITGKEGSLLVCVRPLTALMMDQKVKFSTYGLTAEFVGVA